MRQQTQVIDMQMLGICGVVMLTVVRVWLGVCHCKVAEDGRRVFGLTVSALQERM